jgi:hypothetical protein
MPRFVCVCVCVCVRVYIHTSEQTSEQAGLVLKYLRPGTKILKNTQGSDGQGQGVLGPLF